MAETDENEFGPLESAADSEEASILRQQLHHLQEKQQNLLEEKTLAESEFGLKRAKFKELFLQKEEELKQEREKRVEWEDKVKSLDEQLERVRSELEGIKTAAAVSETSKHDEIEEVERHYKQEVDSMQHVMKEVADEASRTTAIQYENERAQLTKLNEKYEEEIQELRTKLSQEREGILASVAKSLKKVGGHITPNTSLELEQEHENLEDSMRKAQEDAQVLKSVVMPLEEEISVLKSKLAEAEEKMKEMETRSAVNGPLFPEDKKSPSLPDLDSVKDPDEKVLQLFKYLKAEKAARKDLEMYVAVLTMQKNVLQEDNDKGRKELHEVCRLLEDEKQGHDALRQTWQMANDQFLESQRLMMMDMRRIESVLSAEQQRQVAEQQFKDHEREAQEKKVKELEEAREKQEKEQEERRKLSVSRMEQAAADEVGELQPNVRTDSIDKSHSPSTVSLNSEDIRFDDEIKKSLSSSDINLDEKFLDGGAQENQLLGDVYGITVRISPDKILNLPSLTEAQMKSITDPTPEVEARRSLLACAKTKSDSWSLEGKRLVSDKEWRLLQDEMRIAREKLGRPCDMCTNYETQLQTVQEELKTEKSEKSKLDRHLMTERHVTSNLTKYVGELENSLKDTSEDAFKQISSVSTKVVDCEQYIKECKQQFVQSQLQLQDQLKTLTDSREQIQKELKRLEDENDSLVGRHSETAQQMQNEDINLPTSMEEMQLLLLKYREEIISAKVAKEHIEESLRSEILFLKDQVVGEQQEKTTMEETLTNELHTLQEKLACNESIKSELERESAVRAECEAKLREAEHSLKSVQAKSRQLIQCLQQRVEEHGIIKSKLQDEIQTLKTQIHSLQTDLDNSEAVQRDFVKLSQSLQIQLEKIRQAETEVRWQHEDDVDDCNNCKQGFSVTRRKHHCKHCGRIFCTECVTKSVYQGPNNRAAKVCDVCHTILVKDATPYFSTEPPTTPD